MRLENVNSVARGRRPPRPLATAGAARSSRARPARGPARQAHLLGRPDLLRERQQAARRHHQRLGRRERRRHRSRDDQPERDRAEGLGGGRVEHDAGRPRPQPRSAAAPVARRASSCPSTISTTRSARRRAAGSPRSPRATDTSKVAGGRTGIPFGVSRQPAAAPQRPARAGGLHRSRPRPGQELVAAGRGGQQAAGLRARPRAFQRRRRQRADRGAAILRRPHRRRRRQEGRRSSPTRRASYLRWVKDAWDKKRLPARQHDLGRRRRQPGLSLRPGGLHRQHRLGRHRGARTQDPELFEATAYLAAAGRPEGRRLADQRRNCAPIPKASQNPDAAKALIEHLRSPSS